MRSRFSFLVLGVSLNALLLSNLHAEGPHNAKYAGEFLSLGAGGRSLGMGGAQVAVVRDVTSGYWNPAGLAYLDYPQFILMHSRRFSGVVNYDYAGAGIPVGPKNSLGLSILRVGIDNIPETELNDPNQELSRENRPYIKGNFSSVDYGLFLTYSKRISQTFSYGGNIKFILRDIGDNSAWGLGFDAGIVMNPSGKLLIGLNLQDVTTTLVAWDTGERELITPALRAGLSYPLFLDKLGGQLHPALDLVFRFENREEATLLHAGPGSLDMNLGWEYVYRNSFSLRLGFADIGQPDAQLNVGKFSAGIGFHLPKLMVDYAFLGHEELGDTHRISARLTLEEPKFMRKK